MTPSTLETKRLMIRQFTQEDFDNLLSFIKNMASALAQTLSKNTTWG